MLVAKAKDFLGEEHFSQALGVKHLWKIFIRVLLQKSSRKKHFQNPYPCKHIIF